MPRFLLIQCACTACCVLAGTAPASARQPDAQRPAGSAEGTLLAVLDKYAASGPAALAPAEIVEFHDLQADVDPREIGFLDELAWWWAAERGLDKASATTELETAYQNKHGQVSKTFRQRIGLALAGLPGPGRTVYLPPSYVISGPAFRIQPILVPRKAPFGIVEKDGINRLSSGIRAFVH
jgi:hypothetical protein